MAKLKVLMYHLYGGLLNSIAAAALIYATGFIELIGAAEQIPYIILGILLGITAFTFAGILIVRFISRPLTVSFVVFILTIAAFILTSPQNRAVSNPIIAEQMFLLFGVLSPSTVLVSASFFPNVARTHPLASGGAIIGWSFVFSIIILSAYQIFSDSKFSLITLIGELIVIAFSLLFLCCNLNDAEKRRFKISIK